MARFLKIIFFEYAAVPLHVYRGWHASSQPHTPDLSQGGGLGTLGGVGHPPKGKSIDVCLLMLVILRYVGKHVHISQ